MCANKWYNEFFNDICICTIIKIAIVSTTRLWNGLVSFKKKEKRDNPISPTLQVMDWICWIQDMATDMATDKYYDMN